VAAEERQKKQARVIHARKRWRRRERMKPTRRSIHRRVEARVVSDEGVLGGYLASVTGSVRWTCNFLDRANVVARGAAGVAHGQNGNNLEPRVEERGVSDKAVLDGSRLVWPGSVDWRDY
jgi:hypothetical protein